jgi:hypothetical protein
MDEVIVKVLTSNTWAFEILPSNYNLDQALIVFALHSFRELAILQSFIHEAWAKWNPSTMKGDSRYTIGRCITSFPFPSFGPTDYQLNEIGKSYVDERLKIRRKRKIGLTKLYNIVNDPLCQDEDILGFRLIVEELNEAVLEAYGWSNIELNYGFHNVNFLPKGKNVIFTICPESRKKILALLEKLNAEYFKNENARLSLKRQPNSTRVLQSQPSPNTDDLFVVNRGQS